MNWQAYAIVAALTSAGGCFLIIRTMLRLTAGSDSEQKIQKLHHHHVLRLGGIPVFLGVTVAGLINLHSHSHVSPDFSVRLWIVLLPAFLIGLLDDFRGGNLGSWCRLLTTMIAVGIGCRLLGTQILRVDVGWADAVLHSSPVVVFVLTLIAGAGIPHAINIIDGCNGLASFVCILAMAGLGVASLGVNDVELAAISFSGAGALLGFLVWNFPFGKLFLGDSGAYFSGLMIAEISMLLVNRHPEISAWFPFALVIYPVWEALYSSFRRARLDPRSIMQPDARHLHQLFFRRVTKPLLFGASEKSFIIANSMSSLPFWVSSAAVTALSLRFRSDPAILLLICVAYAFMYMQTYVLLARTRLRVSHARNLASEAMTSLRDPGIEVPASQIADASK